MLPSAYNTTYIQQMQSDLPPTSYSVIIISINPASAPHDTTALLHTMQVLKSCASAAVFALAVDVYARTLQKEDLGEKSMSFPSIEL